MQEGSKTYFASDFHLGLAAGTDPRERERRVVSWLGQASQDARSIYLLGDIFDFWWEYRTVIPRGFSRFLGTLSSLTDRGIEVHIFTGNHDMWMHGYLAGECGVTVHYEPYQTTIGDELFYLAHGEGLGSRSRGARCSLCLLPQQNGKEALLGHSPALGHGIRPFVVKEQPTGKACVTAVHGSR